MDNFQYISKSKAEYAKKCLEKGLEFKTSIGYETVVQATVLPLKRFPGDAWQFGRGGVVDEQGKYVESSSVPTRVGDSYPHEEPEYHDEKVVYCGYMIKHWGHFLVDFVPRLWFFAKNDSPEIDKYVMTVPYGTAEEAVGNFKRLLELLGIYDKTLIIARPVKFREVIIPEPSYQFLNFYSAEFKLICDRIAENALKEHPDVQSKKIFLTRSAFKKSQHYELNMGVLDSYFRNNGYEIIFPEKLDLAELIALMRKAEVCASCSGSTPLNFIFAADGQDMIIVERTAILINEELDFDIIRNFNTTYIDANYEIYPVFVGSGPCFYAFTDYFARYAEDHHEAPPDEAFTRKAYLVKCLRQYFKVYKEEYGMKWGVGGEWQMRRHGLQMYEAYLDSLKVFGEYLNGSKPFLLRHYFEFRYWKAFIKRMLKK